MNISLSLKVGALLLFVVATTALIVHSDSSSFGPTMANVHAQIMSLDTATGRA